MGRVGKKGAFRWFWKGARGEDGFVFRAFCSTLSAVESFLCLRQGATKTSVPPRSSLATMSLAMRSVLPFGAEPAQEDEAKAAADARCE